MSASYVDVEHLSYPIKEFKGINVVDPEDTTRIYAARNAFNVDFMGRALVAGYGTEAFSIGSGSTVKTSLSDLKPERMFRWQAIDPDTGNTDDRIVVWRKRTELDDAGAIYYVRLADGLVHDTGFRVLDDISCVMNYKFDGKYGFVIFQKNGGAKCIYHDDTFVEPNVPAFSDVLFYGGKFFGIMKETDSRIFWHTNTNPYNWREDYPSHGYIDLENEGKCVLRRLLGYKDNVYAFSDYGITRLTLYTDKNSVRSTTVVNFRGKLLKGTPVVAGDVIIFATTAGVYTFDGFSLKKIYDYVTPIILEGKGDPTAYYYQDKYYLSARIENGLTFMGDETALSFSNNAVFIFDLVDEAATISRGFDVKSFYEIDYNGTRHLMIEPASLNVGTLCEFKKEMGKNLYMSLKKYWETPFTDMCDNFRVKCVRRITLTTLGEVTVTVKVDDESYAYTVKGSDRPQTIVVNKTGDRFSVSIATSKPDFRIYNMAIELDLIRRYNGHQ